MYPRLASFFNGLVLGETAFRSSPPPQGYLNYYPYIKPKKHMSYYFSKTIPDSFDNAIQKVTEALKEEGFGVLTEIDIKATLKKKLDVDFYNYTILGACNPPSAYKALQAEDKIGTMLPCNVIVQEKAQGQVEVSAVDPAASMQAIDNPELTGIARDIGERLQKVINSL
jgi:uncharacterized protein (DUF302 family)